MRMCGTPGCTKRDFHTGGHSFEIVPRRETTVRSHTPLQREGNQFQLGIGFAREAMKCQHGVVINLPADIAGTDDRCDVTVQGAHGFGDGTHDVLFATTKDNSTIILKDTDLMRADVYLNWKPLAEQLILKHRNSLKGKHHEASDRRIDMFVKVIRDNCITNSEHKIYSLDGDGCNIEAFRRNVLDMTTKLKPRFIVCDINPVPALGLQLLYGRNAAFFTGALSLDKFGYGCNGAHSKTPPGIEYLITTRTNTSGISNTLITQADCDSTIALNLDFCGGILGGLDFEAANRTFLDLLARLPNLVALCVTFGKRQRQALKHDFEKYASTPFGFGVVHTFDEAGDNQRVVSRIYTRIWSVPRTLNVPGMLWNWTKSKSESTAQRLVSYRCVVKSIEPQTGKYLLYCTDDDEDNHLMSLKPNDLEEFAINDSYLAHSSTFAYCDTPMLERVKKRVQLQNEIAITMIQRQIDCNETKNKRPLVSDDDNPSKMKRTYKCSKCGQPKKGHTCRV